MAFPPLIYRITWFSSFFSPAKTLLMSSMEISTGTSRSIPPMWSDFIRWKTLVSVLRRFEHHLFFTLVQQSLLLNNSTIFPSMLVKVKSSLIPGKWLYSLRFCSTLEERISSPIVPEVYSVCSSGYLRLPVQVSIIFVGAFSETLDA